ncbi:hypothetical protein BZA77DRAFT_323684 [Pyronema omphalodes]|nr:hypothetical protein BZA77DRAFT_323684 [Pyronema omphalodes]
MTLDAMTKVFWASRIAYCLAFVTSQTSLTSSHKNYRWYIYGYLFTTMNPRTRYRRRSIIVYHSSCITYYRQKEQKTPKRH